MYNFGSYTGHLCEVNNAIPVSEGIITLESGDIRDIVLNVYIDLNSFMFATEWALKKKKYWQNNKSSQRVNKLTYNSNHMIYSFCNTCWKRTNCININQFVNLCSKLCLTSWDNILENSLGLTFFLW